MSSKGYLIPDNESPPDDFCVRVYIPNDEGYKQAFLGSYLYFASWVAWERTNDRRGRLAALRWQSATEKTLNGWSGGCDGQGCEYLDMTEDEFREFFAQELEKMAITIYNENNCGCCSGSGSGVTTVSDDTPPDGYEIPVTDPTEPSAYTQGGEKCDRATYLMVAFRNACLGVAEKIQGPFQDVMDYFFGVFLGLSVFDGFDYDDYLRLKTWVMGTERDTFNLFVSAYDQNFDAMVCAIFSATTAKEAKDNVRVILDQYVWSQIDIFPRFVFKSMWEVAKMEYIFDLNFPANLPPGFQNRNCCGTDDFTVNPDPDPSPGYVLLPVVFSTVTLQTLDGAANMQAYFDGNDIVFSHSGATGTNVFRPRARWNINLTATKTVAGIVRGALFIPRVHSTVGVNRTLYFDDSWGLNTRSISTVPSQQIDAPILVRHAYADVPAETVALENWVLTMGGQSYEDTVVGVGDAVVLESTGDGNPLPVSASYRYSCWLLVKVT